jgi:hypothetical protein
MTWCWRREGHAWDSRSVSNPFFVSIMLLGRLWQLNGVESREGVIQMLKCLD